jgi:hypothetical protein
MSCGSSTRFGHPLGPALCLARQFQPDGNIARDRHVRKQAYILENIADAPTQDMGIDRVDRFVTEENLSAVRFDQPVDHFQQC